MSTKQGPSALKYCRQVQSLNQTLQGKRNKNRNSKTNKRNRQGTKKKPEKLGAIKNKRFFVRRTCHRSSFLARGFTKGTDFARGRSSCDASIDRFARMEHPAPLAPETNLSIVPLFPDANKVYIFGIVQVRVGIVVSASILLQA